MQTKFIPDKPDMGEPQILILDQDQTVKCMYMGSYRGKESRYGGFYHHIRTFEGLDFIIYPFTNLTRQLKTFRIGVNIKITYLGENPNKYGTKSKIFHVTPCIRRDAYED